MKLSMCLVLTPLLLLPLAPPPVLMAAAAVPYHSAHPSVVIERPLFGVGAGAAGPVWWGWDPLQGARSALCLVRWLVG